MTWSFRKDIQCVVEKWKQGINKLRLICEVIELETRSEHLRPDPELDRIPSSVRTQEPGQWWHGHEQEHEPHPSQSAWQSQQHSETQCHTLALSEFIFLQYSILIFWLDWVLMQTLGIVNILAHGKILLNRQTNGQRIPFRSISALYTTDIP